MAEGGDENEDNPFSFKKFVSPRDKENETTEESEHTMVNGQVLDILPDIGDSSNKNRRKERATLVISDDESQIPIVSNTTTKTKKKKNGESNPFSFKKFLSGSSTSSAGGGARPKTFNTQNSSGSRITPDLATDLPDFVQDHFSEQAQDLNLPDFAVSSHLNNTNLSSHSHNNEVSSDSANGENHTDNEPVVMATGGTSSLPDFLSDGILKNDCELHSENRISTFEVNGDYELELRRMREENSVLRKQLEEARKEALTESQRCHKMKKNMEDIQKKEAEENTALENMVQQIEANLTTTTQRAVQAENTVSKLQTEVKGLQKQLTSLRSENELLRSGDHGLAEIRERTKYSSEQLMSAANTAEQNLKQLLQGVDQMKMLAQVLSSIDKITEEKSDEQSKDGQNNKAKHRQNKKTEKDNT